MSKSTPQGSTEETGQGVDLTFNNTAFWQADLYLNILTRPVIVLIDCLQPANVVVSMGHQVHVQLALNPAGRLALSLR